MSDMNGAMVKVESAPPSPSGVDARAFFRPDQIDLIKRQIAKGCSDDELALFLHQCARTGLDPFSRQIYAVMRTEWDPSSRSESQKMTIQTGIDGLRLIADRTHRYAPGPEHTFEYDADGKLRKATAHVMKLAGGTWHRVSASALFDEYAQMKKDRQTGRQTPTKMWAEKPHIMLGKCAEALALRKAFPAEMSGIYTGDEMAQADAPAPEYTPPKAEVPPKAPPAADLSEIALKVNKLCLMKAPEGLGWTKVGAKGWLKKRFGFESTSLLTTPQLSDAVMLLEARMESEDTYDTMVEQFATEGRCLGDGEVSQ